jgi:hypothetical protein
VRELRKIVAVEGARTDPVVEQAFVNAFQDLKTEEDSHSIVAPGRKVSGTEEGAQYAVDLEDADG